MDASGQEIQLSHYTPTLTVNLRAKKRDELKEHIKPSGASASGTAAGGGGGAGSGASSAESKVPKQGYTSVTNRFLGILVEMAVP